MAKLGPGSVAIVFGMVFSSNLVGSNLDVIDYYTHSWPFLVPGSWTKTTTNITYWPKHKYEYREHPRVKPSSVRAGFGAGLADILGFT